MTRQVNTPSFTARRLRLSLIAMAVTSLTACGSLVKVEPLDATSMAQANRQGTITIAQGVEPISAPLSLEEAMARALKYNLDRRVKLMEEALSLQQLDVSQLDMLPRLTANAGYNWRDSDRETKSFNLTTQQLEPSKSITQERMRWGNDLTFTWSLLDLGLGYYNTQQQANRVMIALEKRRKAMHTLMQDVRTAYWRAASAQKLRGSVRNTIQMAEKALQDARQSEADRVRNPLDAIRFQRQLLENMRLLEAINQELSSAQIELAALVNAPLGKTIEIANEDIAPLPQSVFGISAERMEEEALANNADLRESHYNVQLAREEARKTLVRLFPNVSFNYAYKYDTDNYLVHNDWREAGLQLSFNLFNVFTGPTQMKLAEAGVALADLRRVASHASVVTQVHLARQMLFNANTQYERANEIYAADQKIAQLVKNRAQSQAQSQLDMVANETAAILSLLRRYQAMAQVQSAESRLLATLGLEPQIDSVTSATLNALTQQIKVQNNPWTALQQARVPTSVIKVQPSQKDAK